MQVTLEHLQAQPLFKDVETSVLEQLLQGRPQCRFWPLAAGRKLNFEINGTRYLYILKKGYVTIRSKSALLEDEEDGLFLAWCGPDAILGEMGIISPHKTLAGTVKAVDDCLFIAISTKVFLREANHTPQLYLNLAVELVKKNRWERQRCEVNQMPGGIVYHRVAKTLENLLDERYPNRDIKEAIEIDGTIRIRDIAGYVGASDDAVGASLAALHKSGIIKRDFRISPATGKLTSQPTGKITVLDHERLKEACYRSW